MLGVLSRLLHVWRHIALENILNHFNIKKCLDKLLKSYLDALSSRILLRIRPSFCTWFSQSAHHLSNAIVVSLPMQIGTPLIEYQQYTSSAFATSHTACRMPSSHLLPSESVLRPPNISNIPPLPVRLRRWDLCISGNCPRASTVSSRLTACRMPSSYLHPRDSVLRPLNISNITHSLPFRLCTLLPNAIVIPPPMQLDSAHWTSAIYLLLYRGKPLQARPRSSNNIAIDISLSP